MYFPSGNADPYSVNLIQLIIGLSLSQKQSTLRAQTELQHLLSRDPGPGLTPRLCQTAHCSGREEGAMWISQYVNLRWCLKNQNGASHWRAFVLLSTGEVWWSAHSRMRPVQGQCPVRQCNLCLHDLLQAPCYTLLTPGWKNIAQDDTAVRFSTLYQHLRFKSIVRKTFLWLIFSRALSSKTSLKQSWCCVWTWPLSEKA